MHAAMSPKRPCRDTPNPGALPLRPSVGREAAISLAGCRRKWENPRIPSPGLPGAGVGR